MKHIYSILSIVIVAFLSGATSAFANKIMISDSYSARYHAYPSYETCTAIDIGWNNDCKYISEDCDGYYVYVSVSDFKDLWAEYNAGETLHVYMADDEGDELYDMCSLRR